MSKFYVVWKGRTPGVYTTWKEAEAQVANFPQAKFKSFPTEKEAYEAFAQPPTTPSKKVVSEKRPVKNSILEEMDIHIYCDGGCDPNPGQAGSGVSVYENKELSALYYGLYTPTGTNNSAELNAIHQALALAHEYIKNDKQVQILCDSMYSINCITNWANSWKANSWTKNGGEIKNLAIIKEAHSLFLEIKDKIIISHIKAHIGFEGNELADRMSMLAITKKEESFKNLEEPFDILALLNLREG